MSESERWLADVTKELSEEFTPQGYPVTTNEVGYCLMKFASYFNDEAAAVLPNWGKDWKLDTSKSKEILGIQYRPAKESFSEMVNMMIENGWIEDKRKK